MEIEDVVLHLIENGVITQDGFNDITSHLVNIEAGLQIILYVLIGFLVWMVLKALYKLFGGIFFGGV